MTGDLFAAPDRVATILGFAGFRGAIEGLMGPLSDQALALQIFALYLGSATLTPLVGGWLGDRVLGRRLAVIIGGVTIALGHLAMTSDRNFLVALALVAGGNGLFGVNLKAQLAGLYAPDDPRLPAAFQLYYVVLCVAAFIAPLVSGAVAAVWGWHAGFGVASVAMTLGLAIYLAGQRHLPSTGGRARTAHRATSTERLSGRIILGLAILWLAVFLYSMAQAQAQVWNVYNLWLRDHVDMTVGGFAVPVPWMQSLDGLAPAVAGIVAIVATDRRIRRGASVPSLPQITAGMLLFAASMALLAAGPFLADRAGRAPILLPVAFHLLSNIAVVLITPVVSAMAASSVPTAWRGRVLAVFATALALATFASGPMGGLYERLGPASFWLINALICSAGGMLLALLRRPVERLLGVQVRSVHVDGASPAKACPPL